jgi:hypothetical protein
MPFAISDPKNKLISGCKNKFELAHEESHLLFNKSNLGMNIQYLFQLSEEGTIIFTVLSLFINFFKWFALFGVFLILFFFTFEEVWCNYTAREKLKEKDLNI